MINASFNNSALKIISRHGIAEIIQNTVTNQRSLHALVPFKSGDLISRFTAGEIYKEPNYLTVQKGIDEHITLQPDFLQYINHSCNPNVFFDTAAMEIIAIRDIEPSEEFSFFYPSAEWDMAQPFICFCGTKNCLQNIKGAKYIPDEIIKNYRVTDFIKEQLQQKSQSSFQ